MQLRRPFGKPWRRELGDGLGSTVEGMQNGAFKAAAPLPSSALWPQQPSAVCAVHEVAVGRTGQPALG